MPACPALRHSAASSVLAGAFGFAPVSNIGQTEVSTGAYCGDIRKSKKGDHPLTPHQTHLAEQVSKEMDSVKLLVLVAEFCRALDNEHEENLFRVGCRDDCREHQKSPSRVLGPQLARYGTRSACTSGTVGEGT